MTKSPDLSSPLAFSRENVPLRLFSMSSVKLRQNGATPHSRFSCLCIEAEGVKANIGQSGR